MKEKNRHKSLCATQLDKSSGQPAYQQLADLLRAQIADETWPPGRKIPSEPILARQAGVSVMTVRQAVGQLVEEGLLAREQGRGTFVRGLDWRQCNFSIAPLLNLFQNNEHLKMRLLKLHTEKLEAETARMLMLPEGGRVISILRLFMLFGQPYLLQKSFLRPEPDLPVVESDFSLTDIGDFFSSGQSVRIKKARLGLAGEAAAADEAALLDLGAGAQVYRLSYVFYDFSDLPLGSGWVLLPANHLKLESQLGLWN